MRQSLTVFIFSLFLLVTGPLSAESPFAYAKSNPVEVDSLDFEQEINSYILKDMSTSKVLMSKNSEKRVQPASLTKILTAIIAIESGKLGNVVIIPEEATNVEPTKAGFDPGEKIRLVDLVKASMVRSSNDAAFAIAYYLGGGVDGFAGIMNRKAKEIGMKHSHFTNPAGYDRDVYAGHYSTAGDLLLLTEYAIGNEIFNRVVALDSVSFFEQETKKKYFLKSSNKLLENYPYAVGIKTGYTLRAGRCLIARAKRDDKDMVLVMLKAGKKRWELAEKMFEQAFAEDQKKNVSFRPDKRENVRPLILKSGALQ
jgi:D-alanyl-D-alanine carboxypeptidase (penicillin-binding protein 5/6)